ncbi:MAG: hypothetical protein Q9160_008928 [Pyrenula sp. 1 TL-2023]
MDDDDDISLTSTQSSVHSDNSEYEIEEVVATRRTERGAEYLVRWLGYDISRATWEPASQFADEDALNNWEIAHDNLDSDERRRRVATIESAVRSRDEDSQRRTERRQQLRKAQSKSESPSPRVKKEADASASDPLIFRKLLKRKRSDHPDLTEVNEKPFDQAKQSNLPTRNVVRSRSDKTLSKQVMSTAMPTAKRTKSEPRIPKYLSGQQGTLFRNMSTQYRVQKILGAEPAPDKSALKLITADQIDSEMEKAYALRASDPLGLRSAYETVGDRRRARDALKPQTPCEDLTTSNVLPAIPSHSLPAAPAVQRKPSESEKRVLGNGRFCYRDEILVKLSFDRNFIGDVRFQGFDYRSRANLLRMKDLHVISMNAREVWEKRTYIDVCKGRSNQVFSAGRIIGFEDNQSEVLEMANYLHHYNCIALFWHPFRCCVFIFYSILSRDWHFFEDSPIDLPTEQELRVVCRNYFDNLPVADPVTLTRSPDEYLVRNPSDHGGFLKQAESPMTGGSNLTQNMNFESSRDPRLQSKRTALQAQGSFQDQQTQSASCTETDQSKQAPASPTTYFLNSPQDVHAKDPSLMSKKWASESSTISKVKTSSPETSVLPEIKSPMERKGLSHVGGVDSLQAEKASHQGNERPPDESNTKLPQAEKDLSCRSNLNSSPVSSLTSQSSEKTTESLQGKAAVKQSLQLSETARRPTFNIASQISSAEPDRSAESPGNLQGKAAVKLSPPMQETKPKTETEATFCSSSDQSHQLERAHESEYEKVIKMSPSEALLNHTYKTSIQWSGSDKSNIDCFVFYLIFPEAYKQELIDIENFIDKQPTTNYIFSGSHPTEKTFSKFSTLITRTARTLGVIIMHSTGKDVKAIPHLATLLKGPSQVPPYRGKSLPKLNIFAVSLQEPIFELASAGHLQRLFPHQGVCLLVTEASMRKEPSNTLAILKWFDVFQRKKRNWKICLRPRIRPWLNKLANSERDATRRILMAEMLQTVNRIIPDSSIDSGDGLLTPDSHEDGYESIGKAGDSDDEGVSAPVISLNRLERYGQPPSNPEVSQLTKNEHVLMEWFAGWACKRADRHRCFTAITTESLKDWTGWNHIEIITPAKFMEDLGINPLGKS